MELKYICNNEKCVYPKKKPFVLNLKMDAVMDEKNVADLFCPHCKKPLNRREIKG